MGKKVIAGVLLTLVIVVFIAAYWVTEPARQSAATVRFKREAEVRGAALFADNCTQCHGAAGQGLIGPALAGTRLDESTLKKAIARGRAGGAMPAWGDEDGGPLKPNQLQDLVTFIHNWDASLLGNNSIVASTPHGNPGGGAGPNASQPPSTPPKTTPSLAEAGKQLFSSAGCGACHGTGGEGTPIAPALTGLAGKGVQLASGQVVVADDPYLKESVVAPDAKIVKGYQPGMMPKLGLSAAELDQLVEFMKSLH